MTNKQPELIVDVERIATEFDCSVRTIQRLVEDGMPREGHGKYDLLACWRWYGQKLRKDIEDAGEASLLEKEQTRVQRATADLKELELAERRGQLIPMEVFARHLTAAFFTVRQNILALAAQIAPQLEGLDRLEIKTKLHERHRQLCEHLAQAPGVAPEKVTENETESGKNDAGKPAGHAGAADPAGASSNLGAIKRPIPKRKRNIPAVESATRSKPKRMGGKKHNTKKGHK
jgi:phage terminase Nu1 subunit (DNA packaging protein)